MLRCKLLGHIRQEWLKLPSDDEPATFVIECARCGERLREGVALEVTDMREPHAKIVSSGDDHLLATESLSKTYVAPWADT